MKRVVISPHLDDAILSCGGAMAKWVSWGDQVQIVDLFCGYAPPPYSRFAQDFHKSWGAPTNVFELRKEEDLSAAKVIGAKVKFLGLIEALYRKDNLGAYKCVSKADLFGKPDKADYEYVDHHLPRLAEILGRNASVLYFPLGIGNHVDHLLAFHLGEHLMCKGCNVFFYADVPYILKKSNLVNRINEVKHQFAHYKEVTILFEEMQLQKKLHAIGQYKSQLKMLFSSKEIMQQKISNMAKNLSKKQGHYSELFFRLGLNI